MQTDKILTVLAVVFILILSSCKPPETITETSSNTSIPSLNGTSWFLVDLSSRPVAPDTLVTISFENGKINGTDGCNSYSTSYTAKAAKISVNKNIAATMMACPEPIAQQASAYLTVLTQSVAYTIGGQQLTLSDTSGKTLATFTKQNRELDGTSWIVTGFNNGKQAVISVAIGSELTADFSSDGKLSGSAGCNNYIAAYEASGKSIKIGPAATTRKMCAERTGVMEQETQFLKALETAATYRIDGKQLQLRTADGALAVIFANTGTAVASPIPAP
jgi:heat shock protein HslJ